MMDEQVVQRISQGHAYGHAQVSGLCKRINGEYDKTFINNDRFSYNPRQAPGRDGLVFS